VRRLLVIERQALSPHAAQRTGDHRLLPSLSGRAWQGSWNSLFCKKTGVKKGDIDRYWPRFSALAERAGAPVNKFDNRLSDDTVFSDYARICLHLGKIPTRAELDIAQRKLGTKTSTVRKRFGGNREFDVRFRRWLDTAEPALRPILDYDWWRLAASDRPDRSRSGNATVTAPGLHPFLPYNLQYLDVLARGERPPFETSDLGVSTLFERRTADAFRCLGFEIVPFGQGTGRKPDSLALAPRDRFAVIVDAKVRSGGYVLGTEDRKFLEYARVQGTQLRQQGFDNLYFVVVGPSFKDGDLNKLTAFLADSPIRSVDLVTASALMRIVEESIFERSKFSLGQLGQQLFGNKMIAA
jgi:hypothetical protein